MAFLSIHACGKPPFYLHAFDMLRPVHSFHKDKKLAKNVRYYKRNKKDHLFKILPFQINYLTYLVFFFSLVDLSMASKLSANRSAVVDSCLYTP